MTISKKGSRVGARNHRPVSLTLVVCKIMESDTQHYYAPSKKEQGDMWYATWIYEE